ncbi:uncharacterized protein N7479_007386 [Penicillium vulpinum]|uniref:uncharacterized protein n=1 Tax=Penicillium vulpinum TaxID=29845 RepID=UPI0025480303|nr:uncharacterized protein N7479_007386 [Penicillium vulpinum]KAJ5960236.1 hypothetical protein N7479_007386 [Penicillium vulpinum]
MGTFLKRTLDLKASGKSFCPLNKPKELILTYEVPMIVGLWTKTFFMRKHTAVRGKPQNLRDSQELLLSHNAENRNDGDEEMRDKED